MLYMILIPMLVFFFLKDREQILDWLGGFLPKREVAFEPLPAPSRELFENLLAGSERPVSTTMVVVRMLSRLLRDNQSHSRTSSRDLTYLDLPPPVKDQALMA